MIRDRAREGFGVEKMCEIYEASRSGYYAWNKRPKSRREKERAELLKLVEGIFEEFKSRYGSLRICRELSRRGIKASRKRVAALMKKAGLVSKHRRKYRVTTDSEHSHPIAPNILNRDFSVGLPDMTWLSDITYSADR